MNDLSARQSEYFCSQDEEDEQQLDLVIKLKLKRLNGADFELLYPNYNLNPIYLKNIFIKVKPIDSNDNLCQNLLGIYPDVAFDQDTNQLKLIIHGLEANRFSYEQKNQLKLGDLIVSVNNVDVNAVNIDNLLQVLNQNHYIKITTIGALNYHELFSDKLNESILSTNNKIVAASKSTQVVLGDRVKCNDGTNSSLSQEDIDVSYLVMVLAFGSNSDTDQMKDLIYKYPKNETDFSRRMSGIGELIKTIRGLFVTLAFTIKEMSQNDEAVCCMIEHKDQLFHVCFLHENYSKRGILILVMPMEQISLNYLKILSKNLNQTFKFTFGDLFTKLVNERLERRLSEQEKLKISHELDTFFAQIKNRFIQQLQTNMNTLLNRSTTGTLMPQQNQAQFKLQESIQRMNLLNELRSKFFDSNAVPYLDLPVGLKCDVDSALNDLEAQEFVDLENSYYLNRRMFSIKGSCLFYKDFVIANHLNTKHICSIYRYLEHYGYFNLLRNGCINQTMVWKEVFIVDKSISSTRHFLIVIGLKEFLLGVLLENGGVISRQIDSKHQIQPNPIYIQQATFVLNDLHESGLMSEINRYYNFTSGRQILFNINKFLRVKQPLKQNQLTLAARSRSKSPKRIPLLSTIQRTKSTDSQHHLKPASINQVDNVKIDDLETNNEYVYQYHKEYRHKSPLNLNRTYLNDNESFRFFNDVVLNEAMIYYASNTYNTNGIIYSPKKYDYSSSLFTKVFSNFIQSCFKIRNLFELEKLNENETNKNEVLIEQGVLFNIILLDDSNTKTTTMNSNEKTDQKNTSIMSSLTSAAPCANKTKELNFWVVGRRRFKREMSTKKWLNLGDVFVCFHDAAEQILLELAFDIGFCKINY